MIAISNSDVVNSSTINTHAPSTVFLRNQQNRNGTRTKAFTNIPAVQKVLDLPMNLLSLLRIGPISSTVRQACSWNEINLVCNLPYWRTRRGYVASL